MDAAHYGVGPIRIGGITQGICLGYNFTSTHEHGVEGMARRLGFDPYPRIKRDPVSAAWVTKSPKDYIGHYRFVSKRDDVSYLVFSLDVQLDRVQKIPVSQERFNRHLDFGMYREMSKSDDRFRTAWDSQGFIIRDTGEPGFLWKLYQALLRRHVLIFERSDRRKAYPGLCIVKNHPWLQNQIRVLIEG